MSDTTTLNRAAIPSVDRLLQAPAIARLMDRHGRPLVVDELRALLATLRQEIADGQAPEIDDAAIADALDARIEALLASRLKRVFNLTGTVLHTNLGRAPLPEEAIAAVADVARGASNLEFDLARGRRGDRDDHLEDWVCRLTGAEAATVVNNNAAAVLLVLNTLGLRKEIPLSRGELIEIGGAFRMPDIMARAGCRLVEVGTTNRTHPKDFIGAIGPRTAALMKVHTSNYEVHGFTAAVAETELAAIAHDHDLPLIVDLGSGSLIDMTPFGLPHEPTVRETLAAGVDVVTFSGDKLLGGPQAGLIAGRADLIARIKRNPMKRAMRCDKMTIAALAAVLRLYADPARVAERLPTLRLLTRPVAELRALAQRLQPALAAALGDRATVDIADSLAQIGSGSLPTDRIASVALRLAPTRGGGGALKRLAAGLRALPLPVIGHIHDDRLWLDLRCLDDEAGFVCQLGDVKFG
jgi:L-seryl-tRNA(Ser) seleniumtransferase